MSARLQKILTTLFDNKMFNLTILSRGMPYPSWEDFAHTPGGTKYFSDKTAFDKIILVDIL
jgi:hypothetical protein